MTKEAILTEVERQMGPLDARAERAVSAALNLVGLPAVSRAAPAPTTELQWQGENPPWQEALQLSFEARGRLNADLCDHNREWYGRKCQELRAGWVVVVDGRVVAHGGPRLESFPRPEQLEALGQTTGKFPAVFVHPAALAIEESLGWHPTAQPNDFYPTLAISLSSQGTRIDMIGDFDTGASGVFVGVELLQERGLIGIGATEFPLFHRHLSVPYAYVVRTFAVTLTADNVARHRDFDIVCIVNWRQSPFVSINPDRTALVGRDLCLALKIGILLDFAQHETTLQW